jgi:hypothetical protein
MLPDDPTPQVAAVELRSAIDEVLPLFQGADERRTTIPRRPGGWCAREILGHLVDSACNNHRRFVIGQSASTTRFEGYEQDVWVAAQKYRDVPWRDLLALWTAYNRHLAHVMHVTPPEAASRGAISPDSTGPVTVGFLMHDYVRHLRHHVAQIRALLET